MSETANLKDNKSAAQVPQVHLKFHHNETAPVATEKPFLAEKPSTSMGIAQVRLSYYHTTFYEMFVNFQTN